MVLNLLCEPLTIILYGWTFRGKGASAQQHGLSERTIPQVGFGVVRRASTSCSSAMSLSNISCLLNIFIVEVAFSPAAKGVVSVKRITLTRMSW